MIKALATWLREHREIADLLLLTPFGFLCLADVLSRAGGYATPVDLGFLGLGVVLVVPLVWRRRWPLLVFTVIALACFAQWSAGLLLGHNVIMLANLSVLIAMYTVAAETNLRWGLAAAAVCAFGAALAFYGFDRQWNGWAAERSNMIALALLVGVVWSLGIYSGTRRAYLQSLEERARRLERERDNQVQIAMAAERARIARELHDVVAHNVSVMVVQADGGAFMVDSDPPRARQALEAISETGRTALKEMRLLLGVLRDGDAKGPYAPQPGVDQINDLIEQTRAAGLPVVVTVEGSPQGLATGLQLTVYRIVQEALTNALKHAGPAATATIFLGYGDDRIRVRVADDGRGAAAADDGMGHGLAGMRERVAMYGGTVTAGPVPGDGFEVAAELPVRGAK
ncbi:sensor histidine kinase [Actinocorallia longicatena]|uniref:histidine kinase n=1 Tax=Actinocorallia longicatena TaxID=111803 RepID=A0ABP6QKJ0_9ACTN